MSGNSPERVKGLLIGSVISLVFIVVIISILGIQWFVSRERETRLVSLIAARDVSRISDQIRIGANPNAKDPNGTTVLIVAAIANDRSLIRLALYHGADPNVVDNSGNAPLHYATETDVIEELLIHGASVTVANDQCWQPIHVASHNGRAKAIRLLVQHGADVNSRVSSGPTPLMLATEGLSVEGVRTLLQLGADPMLRSVAGSNALSVAREKLNEIRRVLPREYYSAGTSETFVPAIILQTLSRASRNTQENVAEQCE